MIFARHMAALALIAGVAPALAATNEVDVAERRLGACLSVGSAGAPRTGLAEAVRALRVLCTSQIKTLSELRVRNATAGLAGAEADRVARNTIRATNDDIAVAISRLTGLTG